jgi:hypothetical protein
MKEINGGYRITGKLLKVDFKRLTGRVIDFDNQCLVYMVVLRFNLEL